MASPRDEALYSGATNPVFECVHGLPSNQLDPLIHNYHNYHNYDNYRGHADAFT